MSEQVIDPFIIDGQEFALISAQDIYSLFDPAKYELFPDTFQTCCWKGFICYFSVRGKQLYLDRLDIHTQNHKYPRINGIKAKRKTLFMPEYHEYHRLNLKLNYSGIIVIGQERESHYEGGAFVGEDGYKKIKHLSFQNGILVAEK